MSATRETVERTLTSIVPLPCGHHWWVYSAPTFALGGLAISMVLGRSKLWGAGIGGLLGFLIHRYSQAVPATNANQVSPALRAAATAVGEAARAAEDARRVEQGLAPRWSSSSAIPSPNTLATRVVPRQTLSPEAVARANQQMIDMRANSDLVAYCRGPYERESGTNVSPHVQECAAGGWREAIPQFRCFRAPSFQY